MIIKDKYFGSSNSDNTQPNDACPNQKINDYNRIIITVCHHPFQQSNKTKKGVTNSAAVELVFI